MCVSLCLPNFAVGDVREELFPRGWVKGPLSSIIMGTNETLPYSITLHLLKEQRRESLDLAFYLIYPLPDSTIIQELLTQLTFYLFL